MAKKYRNIKCVVCGYVSASRAKTPRCSHCGTRKVNEIEGPLREHVQEDDSVQTPAEDNDIEPTPEPEPVEDEDDGDYW